MSQVHAFILGHAQQSYHDVESVDHPLILMQSIARKALTEAGIQPEQLDTIACVDPFSWTYADLGQTLANDLGCRAEIRDIWLPAGGTTPQDLLHQITASMAAEEMDVALIVGAEAMRTRRKATRAGEQLPWPPRDKSVSPTRGQKPFSSEWEAKHGLRLPIQSFPIHENAIRHAHGRTANEQVQVAASLLHKNALVAADNEHAWFQDAPSVELIGSVTEENRLISYPYTKRMNAIMDVDQAAAIVVVSERVIDQLGNRDSAAAILGGAGAEEIWNPIERRSLSTCKAMEVAFNAALASAGLEAADIDAFDFYSCFPSPIQMALDALNIPVQDPRSFSLTGGLAYAGGPGNNYVMHSLATAVEKLKAIPEQTLMVTGVGMANTKHAATLLTSGANIPESTTGETEYRVATGETPLAVAEKSAGPAAITSYTIEYDRSGQPTNVIYLLDLAEGARAIANARDPIKAATELLVADPIGAGGQLEWDAEADRQFFTLGI
ncbi:MAG: hypothetical protein GKR90_16030 [Pseudomonadales bacterium]|nr:hypothetical protein [Pseudomonadales bacterium]